MLAAEAVHGGDDLIMLAELQKIKRLCQLNNYGPFYPSLSNVERSLPNFLYFFIAHFVYHIVRERNTKYLYWRCIIKELSNVEHSSPNLLSSFVVFASLAVLINCLRYTFHCEPRDNVKLVKGAYER